MATQATISPKELERVAGLAYEGEDLKVMLCSLTSEEVDASSTVATWQTYEISGNGYSRYTEQIGSGAYSATTGSYLLPEIEAEFTATSAGYSYNYVVLYIDGATYPHSVVLESPNIVLSSGQTQTYKINLIQDD